MSTIIRRAAWIALCWASVALAATPPSAPAPSSELENQSRALERASQAVVGVQVLALEDARSNATLGRLRQGSGVVIGPDGLVLTIGYLVLEADQVQLVLDKGSATTWPPASACCNPWPHCASRRCRSAARAPWPATNRCWWPAAATAASSAWPAWCRGAALPATGNIASTVRFSPPRPAPTTAARACSTAGVNWSASARWWLPKRARTPRLAAPACRATCSFPPTSCARSWPSCAPAACPAPAGAPGSA
jgi:hypothetical protein